MGENKTVATYISKVQNLVHLMKVCGETMINKIFIEKVIRTLTFHLDHVIMAIQ